LRDPRVTLPEGSVEGGMRARLIAWVVGLTLLAATVSPAPAVAAPGQPAPQIAIQFQVHLLTPATLLVTVAAECAPWSGGNGFIIVAVEQPIAGTTNATEGVGTATVPCDGNTYDVVVDVVCPFALKDEEWAEDEAGDKEGEEGDANEAPEKEEALLEECAETGGGAGLVAEESAGNEKEVNDEKERDGGMVRDGAGGAYWAFVEMEVGFADGAEIKAAGEALGGEGVVEEFGELKVEADGEEEGQEEIEEIGPEKRGEAPQREREAVDEDVAAFKHGAEPF